MKSIATLIQMRDKKVIERQRALNLLIEQDQLYSGHLEKLEKRLSEESQLAAYSPVFTGAFSAFNQRAQRIKKEVEKERRRLSGLIKYARDQLARAYSNKKTLEIYADNVAAKEMQKLQKNETQATDAMAIASFTNLRKDKR